MMVIGQGLSNSYVPRSTRVMNSGSSMNRHHLESTPGRSGSLWSDMASRFARQLPPFIEETVKQGLFPSFLMTSHPPPQAAQDPIHRCPETGRCLCHSTEPHAPRHTRLNSDNESFFAF